MVRGGACVHMQVSFAGYDPQGGHSPPKCLRNRQTLLTSSQIVSQQIQTDKLFENLTKTCKEGLFGGSDGENQSDFG